MGHVRVVTDSTAYISEPTVERLGIRVLPHTIYCDHV